MTESRRSVPSSAVVRRGARRLRLWGLLLLIAAAVLLLVLALVVAGAGQRDVADAAGEQQQDDAETASQAAADAAARSDAAVAADAEAAADAAGTHADTEAAADAAGTHADGRTDDRTGDAAPATSPAAGPDGSPRPPAPLVTDLPLPPGPPSDERRLERVDTIRGDIAPKSVVASHFGLFLAQNMMYRHTVTVYDRERTLVATIDDTVTLEEFGLPGPGVPVRGAPVEAAVTPDGAYAYVSNYRMSGPGFTRPGGDTCAPADRIDESTLYRIDLATLEIDQVIAVGAIPKYVAVTPDGSTVLVTNWCSYDLSIVDVARAEEVARLDLGRYPRGIAVSPDSRTAYVALMGGTEILAVDLEARTTEVLARVGRSPRHLVLSPDGDTLYATLNAEGVVIRLDLATGEVARVATGSAPRSMDIAPDGRSLYVVNYRSNTVTKVRTSDLAVLQTEPTAERPIGITVDRATGQVWVATYSGTIAVFDEVADG